jgi:hypothetical protein
MKEANFDSELSKKRNWDEEWRLSRIDRLKRLLANWPEAPSVVRQFWEEKIARLERGELEGEEND